MKRMLLSPLLVLALAGCDSEGGGGPTEPTPPPNVNIQGVWTGTANSLSARGTCLADSFLPVTVAVVWTIQRTGDASYTATEVQNNAQVCAFTATVRGDTVTFQPDLARSQGVCGVQNLACTGTRPVRIELSTSRSTMTGVVDGNRMTITSARVWLATDTNTGNSLGEYEVSGRQDLQR
ncbi:MAG TPA: hypothetical protein VN493_15050 [Thermoanaerobaculia bacterium]|nr:hypothetical protein [Thermoanaerobaculia bacterium]